jgi:hypothetical protein
MIENTKFIFPVSFADQWGIKNDDTVWLDGAR